VFKALWMSLFCAFRKKFDLLFGFLENKHIMSTILKIYIVYDGQITNPEVQISGSAKALIEFGNLLSEIQVKTSLSLSISNNTFYPLNVKTLIIEPIRSDNDRLAVMVDYQVLELRGTYLALDKLAGSLTNFFDTRSTRINDHFHLNFYEENEDLNEPSCSLTFMCDS